MSPDRHVGDVIDLAEDTYRLAGKQGGVVTLRNERDGSTVTTTASALARVPARPAEFVDDRFSAGRYERLVRSQKQRIREREQHVACLLGKVNPNNRALSAKYNLFTTTREQRVQLLSAETGIAASTLRSWRDRVEATRSAMGLIDLRKERTHDPLSRCSDEFISLMSEVVSRYPEKSTPSGTRLIYEITKEARNRRLTDLPGARSIRRYIKALREGRSALGSARRRQQESTVPERAFFNLPASFAGLEMQTDTSVWEFFVKDDDGHPSRARLTVLHDKASRSIASWTVTIGEPNGTDIALMIVHASTVLEQTTNAGRLPWRVDWRPYPWAADLESDADLERHLLMRPLIAPRRIIRDNGLAFQSFVVRDACERLGIDLTDAQPYTPTDKQMVERMFETIRTQFIQYLPGYVGDGVENRGVHPEDEALLSIYAVLELFEYWVAVCWQNTYHDGLRDPIHPKQRATPNQVALAMYESAPSIPVTLSLEEYVQFLPIAFRTCQRKGFKIEYRWYDHDTDLATMRLQPNKHSRNGLYAVHYDPRNPAFAWVMHSDEHRLIGLHWANNDTFKQPNNATTRRMVRAIARELDVHDHATAVEGIANIVAKMPQVKAAHLRKTHSDKTNRRVAARLGMPVPVPQAVPADESAGPDDLGSPDEIYAFSTKEFWT